MLGRIASYSAQRADRVLAGIAVLAIGCGILVGVGEDEMTLGGSGVRVAPLEIRVSGAVPVRSGPFKVTLGTMRSSLRATPGVVAVRRGPVSGRGRTTTLVVRLSDDAGQAQEAVEEIEANLDAGLLRISFAGGGADLREARSQTIDDLPLLLLATPLVALLAIVALGARGALATLFAAAASVLGAGALCVGASLLIDVSVLALVGAAAAGVPCAVLLCGLARSGAPPRGLAAAALASAAAFGTLAALGVGYLAAVAAGGALASLLSAPLAVAAISAASSLWGLPAGGGRPLQRAFDRLAGVGGRSRIAAAAVALAALAALAALSIPAIRLDPAALGAPTPPSIELWRGLVAAGAGIAIVAAIAAATSRRPLAALTSALAAAGAGSAAAGLTVLVFQDGNLSQLLDFDRGPVSVGALAAAVVAVAAASASQGVATLGDDRTMGRAAAAGALASLVAALLAATLLASSLVFAKTFGFVVAVGLLLDLLLVRGILGAALTRTETPTGATPARVGDHADPG